jgi:hypothetical protein
MRESRSPEYCLARAEQCEGMASQTVLEPTRWVFLQLAAQWRALSAQADLRGLLSPFENATTPRNFSPCGVTLDQNAPVHTRGGGRNN